MQQILLQEQTQGWNWSKEIEESLQSHDLPVQ